VTPGQNAIVKQTWQLLAPNADAAAREFYERLFEIDVSTRPLFRTANMAEQRDKLVKALTMVVQCLDRLEAIVPTIEALGRRHAKYGVTDKHYDAVGVALLWMFERSLGAAWSPAAQVAWSSAYAELAGIMRRAASKPEALAS
jgi:hemoglobin-like flavoprotein